MNRWAHALVGASILISSAAAAQQPTVQQPAVPPRAETKLRISLAEALEQARKNSPSYRQTLNDAGPAGWSVRNAYAALLPTFSVGGSMGYTGSGRSTFGGTTFSQNSPSLTSSYSLSFNWLLSGDVLTNTGTQKANRLATDADITNALEVLRNDITFQYLTSLEASALTDVDRQQVQRNADFLALARAKYEVGQSTMLDVRQAEVLKAQSDVALLRAQQAENEAKLELFRRMGVVMPELPEAVALVDSFQVSEPQFDEKQLLSLAHEENPGLKSLRARENAAAWGTKAAKSRFLPSLSARAGYSAFTQEFTNTDLFLSSRLSGAQSSANTCRFQNALIGALPGGGVPGYPNGGIIADCNAFANLNPAGDALDPTFQQTLISNNNVFPFSFTKQPFSASISISLPVFDGFSRNLQVAQARAAEQDAAEGVRARELLVQADVAGKYLAVINAYRAIQAQEQSRVAAREQIRLAQDRYRLGSGSSLEVSDAQNAVTRAEGDYVTAVYEYHKAVALLELAVGRPLR